MYGISFDLFNNCLKEKYLLSILNFTDEETGSADLAQIHARSYN